MVQHAHKSLDTVFGQQVNSARSSPTKQRMQKITRKVYWEVHLQMLATSAMDTDKQTWRIARVRQKGSQ